MGRCSCRGSDESSFLNNLKWLDFRLKLAILRKYGLAGSGLALLGTLGLAFGTLIGLQSHALLPFSLVGGVGWLGIYWTLGETSKYYSRRLIMDSIVGALGISEVVRSAELLYAPQAASLPTPDYRILVRFPPTDATGLSLYVFSLAGSAVFGWLYYRGLGTLSEESGVGLFRITGMIMLVGTFLVVAFGNLIFDLGVLPLGLAFWKMTKSVPESESHGIVVAKSRRSYFKEFWFTQDGIAEVSVIYEDLFAFSLILGVAMSFAFEFGLAATGYSQYTDLGQNSSAFASDFGAAIGVIIALVVSKWRLPEFSDIELLGRSETEIQWKDVKSIRVTRNRRLQIETEDDSYTVSMPRDGDEFMKFVASKIGDRLSMGRKKL